MIKNDEEIAQNVDNNIMEIEINIDIQDQRELIFETNTIKFLNVFDIFVFSAFTKILQQSSLSRSFKKITFLTETAFSTDNTDFVDFLKSHAAFEPDLSEIAIVGIPQRRSEYQVSSFVFEMTL